MSTYEHRRNKLTVVAEKFANKSINDKRLMREGEKRSDRWNRLYHTEMNRLVKEEGI